MNKGYLRNVINEAYVTGSDSKKYAIVYRSGQNRLTRIVDSWEEAKKWIVSVLHVGNDVIKIYKVGAEVPIPNVDKELKQVQADSMRPTKDDMMAGRY